MSKYSIRMTKAMTRTKATALLMALLGLAATSTASAQGRDAQGQGTPYLNKIIERFEAGLPSFHGEDWCNLPGIEGNPFAYPLVEKALTDLRQPGSTKPSCFPVVRIDYYADQDYKHIVSGLLNQGLGGIIIPMVESVSDITKAVAAMRLPPQNTTPDHLRYPYGTRGWNAVAATRLWGLNSDQYATIADVWPLNPQGELMIFVMIETPEAVRQIRNILAVPGLSGVLIGGADLSLAMGLGKPGPNYNIPEVEAEIAEVAAACVDMGKLCGSYISPPDGVCPDAVCGEQYRVKQGFRLFTTGRGNYTGP
ncbi:MAG: aldolase/citrate lyase family protein [Pseudomonadota bacterium]